MTASNSMVSQVSRPMSWSRISKYVSESSAGYRVAAVQQNSQWVFTAAGPEEPLDRSDADLFFRGAEYKTSYKLGEEVPPSYSYRTMTARAALGVFRASNHGGNESGLAAAKQACDEDRYARQ